MLVNSNVITINTTMQKARAVDAAKILCMQQESSINLTPFKGEQYGSAITYSNISFSNRYRTNFLAENISRIEVVVISSSGFNSNVKFLP